MLQGRRERGGLRRERGGAREVLVEGVLGVDHRHGVAELLHLAHRVDGQGGLAARLRAVDLRGGERVVWGVSGDGGGRRKRGMMHSGWPRLDDAAARKTAAEREVQGESAGREGLHLPGPQAGYQR